MEKNAIRRKSAHVRDGVRVRGILKNAVLEAHGDAERDAGMQR